MIATREDLHHLVDQLDPRDIQVAARYLEFLRNSTNRPEIPPFLANAPVDDEPITPEEQEAVAEAWNDVATGATYSHNEVRRRFNLDR